MASTSGSPNSAPAVTADGVTYIYLAKGFFETLTNAGRSISNLVDDMDSYAGESGFCEYLADMADIVEETWIKVREDYTADQWDYDVTEPFGKLLANHLALHHTLPSNDEARAMVLNIAENV